MLLLFLRSHVSFWVEFAPLLGTKRILRRLFLPTVQGLPRKASRSVETLAFFCPDSVGPPHADIDAMSRFLVFTLPAEFSRVEKLVHSVELLYHPSAAVSSATGVERLCDFLETMCFHFALRLRRERIDDLSPRILMDEDCERFAKLLWPLTKHALFSKHGSLTRAAVLSLKHLSRVCPKVVLPAFLEIVPHALQTLTAAHQTRSVLSGLAFVMTPLVEFFRSREASSGISVGFLSDIFSMALPGLDPNDPAKTADAAAFLSSFTLAIPFMPFDPIFGHEFEGWSIQLFDALLRLMSEFVGKKHARSRSGAAIEVSACRCTLSFCVFALQSG
jgi:hypothetical protein